MAGDSTAAPRVVLPFKDLASAKSRLVEVPPALRARIAQQMLLHTVRTWSATGAEVVVVSASPGSAGFLASNGLHPLVLPDPGEGLNAAFRAGAVNAPTGQLVVASMADLPAITDTELRTVLAECAAPVGRWFVPDAEGTGTTLLAARGMALDPLFGKDSAARHRESGATELAAPAGLRRDVDTVGELAEAAAGVGLAPELAALLEDGRPVRQQTGVVAQVTGDGVRLLLDDGTAVTAGAAAVPPDFPRPHPGQRVQLARAGDGTIRQLWP